MVKSKSKSKSIRIQSQSQSVFKVKVKVKVKVKANLMQYRRILANTSTKNIAMTVGIPAAFATAFFFWANINSSRKNSASEICTLDKASVRSFQTPADEYYKEHKKIPPPSIPHTTLTDLAAAAAAAAANEEFGRSSDEDCKMNNQKKKNILVVGDVHGCYDELLDLHKKALNENDQIQFQYVILVGDLCNKGPESAKVIRHARLSSNWFSVRGNHDDGALLAALGERSRIQNKKYQWVEALSDEDVQFLADLPYTIKIPFNFFGGGEKKLEQQDGTIIVHAGLIPNREIEEQEIKTMITIRDLLPRYDEDDKFTHYEYYEKRKGDIIEDGNDDTKALCKDNKENEPVPWGTAWDGPFVIFGHDAKRKLQMYDNAIGLDTGAVYGGLLTGLILSSNTERKLVSVKSKEYSAITDKK
jgi:hypothetical protein